MTPTEFQITSITRSIMFSDIGNGRDFYRTDGGKTQPFRAGMNRRP